MKVRVWEEKIKGRNAWEKIVNEAKDLSLIHI